MAKQCKACNRPYHEALDSCPNCGVAADSVKLPAPRIRVDSAEDLGGWTRASSKRHTAALAQPAAQVWSVHANSGRLPASPAPLNIMAAAELPKDLPRDRSPLSPPSKDDSSARVEINEADIDEDSLGELAIEPGREYPVAQKQPAPSSAASGSDSEFDLRLVWNDEEEPPPSQDQWESEQPTAPVGSAAEDFGVHLLDHAAPVGPNVVSKPIDLPEPNGLPDHDNPADGPTPEDRPAAPAQASETPLMSTSSAEIELPPDEPREDLSSPPEKLLPGSDSVASDDEIDTSLYPSPTLAYTGPETVPIEQALPWFSPPSQMPVPENSRLSNTLLGVLIGAVICFGLWLSGLVPPSSWQLKRAVNFEKASLIGRNEANEHKLEASKTEDSHVTLEASLFTDDIESAFATAVDLARTQKVSAAIDVLDDLCARLEEHRFFNLAEGHDSPETEQALLKASYELLTAWRFEEYLSKKGILSKSRNATRVVEDLLVNNQRLQSTLEALNAKLKAAGSGPEAISLADKIDALLMTREEAKKQAALVQDEKKRAVNAEESTRAALARATALEDRLRLTELNWQKSESKLKELTTKQAAQKAKPLVMPPLKLGSPVQDGKTAYQLYAKGLGLYKNALYAEAEQEFLAAVQADSQDARYYYYLGLARWAQGKQTQAVTDYRAGARMERENKPSRIFVKVALERVDEAALKEINRYRPQ